VTRHQQMKKAVCVRCSKTNLLVVVLLTIAATFMSILSSSEAAVAPVDQQNDGRITTGLRVLTCGHSFHATFIPELVSQIAGEAGIKGHTVIGFSFIGASQAIQHFQIDDAKNPAKAALKAGNVDVLTLSCMAYPDDGVRQFAELGLRYNPRIRVTVQEQWLPEDRWPFVYGDFRHRTVRDFNNATVETLEKTYAPYLKTLEEYVAALNAHLGKQAVFIVPDAQAVIALRGRIIAGEAQGLKEQSDLFADEWGHPAPVLRLLSAYCHYAVIYRRSPVGLPIPPAVGKTGFKNGALNLLLQQLAWAAVIHHPMSGVTGVAAR